MEISKSFQKKSGIYEIKVTGNKKGYIYIGSSQNIYFRLHEHKSKMKNNKHSNPILQNLYNKYESRRFTFRIIEECKISELTIREQHYIDALNPNINITKEVIRNTPSKESALKISDTLKRKRKEGLITHSGSEMKKVEVYSINGEFLSEHESIAQTARFYNTIVGNISRVCNKERKSFNGKIFIFKGEAVPAISFSSKNRIASKQYNIVFKDESGKEINIDNGIHGLYEYLSNNLYKNPNKEYSIRLAPVKSRELLGSLEEDNQHPSFAEMH